MRFDLRHHVVERLAGVGGAGAGRKRKIAEERGSEREVKGDRQDREPDQGHDGGRAAQARDRAGRPIAIAVHGGQQAAADLDARGFGFGRADQAGCDIAVDLGKLIPVDRRLVAAGLRGRAAAQRPKHGKDRRDRHQREHKPQRHQQVPGRNDAFLASADAPLYTTGGKPRN